MSARMTTTLIGALEAFILEHEYCGELDSGVEGDRVWMTCYVRGGDRPGVGAHPLKAAVVVSCGFALLLGACAVANTPQQDLAYARWAKCNAPFGHLQRVDLDGRITFQFTSASERHEILQCLAEADRTGPPLPEPVGVRPPGGP